MSEKQAPDAPLIPSAPVGDLDLDRDEDRQEWERRLMTLASSRIRAARDRLERLGIIDGNGDLVSQELVADMMPEPDITLETG